MDRKPTIGALGQLLDKARLDDASVSAMYERACSVSYWKALCPALCVQGPRVEAEVASIASTVPDVVAHLARHGYFQTEPAFAPPFVEKLKSCVEKLRAAHWPPVFAFVFDEFWAMLRSPFLSSVLASALGAQYRQSANLWVYFIPAMDEARGWPPHADTPGHDDRMTVWIPLTDATLRNGCIYVIPKGLMPESVPRVYTDINAVNRRELGAFLQASRALPAGAGSLLGWDHHVVHWGSVSKDAESPRISISAEFISARRTPNPDEEPLLEPSVLPPFPQRLRLIGKAVDAYRRFEPIMLRYQDLGRRLSQFS